jgi:hypothetical protein
LHIDGRQAGVSPAEGRPARKGNNLDAGPGPRLIGINEAQHFGYEAVGDPA